VERLLAWYRVGSSYGAVAALVAANAIPLVGVLFLGWNVWTILTIYWLENGVVGIFNVLKMAHAEGRGAADGVGAMTIEVNGRPVGPGGAAKATLIPFFIVHYGIFWLVHGIFIFMLPLFAAFGANGGPSEGGAGLASDPFAVVIVIVGLFISHGVSYRLNYIGRGEYLRTNIAAQMFAPYGRLVVMHITILIGGMAIAFTGAPAFAVLVLVVLKTALDLGFHLAEHRDDDTPAVAVPVASGT
jgi:hypothetical protein